MSRIALVALLLGAPAAGAAQGTTAEMLDRAVHYHAELDVEREVAILRGIVSPNSPFIVTQEQRGLAYKYLGAALVVRGQADSGILYFRAAIERDPFTDLEPQKFTPKELAAFGEAKRLTFALGVRPVTPDTIDPRTDRLTFTVLSTHAAALRVELRATGASTMLPLYAGDNDGPRDLQWDGLLGDGRLAPPGRYELLVTGSSRLNERRDSTRLYFSLDQDHSPLDDTLPALRSDELLPEQLPPGMARSELLKGFGLAAAALLIPRTLAAAAGRSPWAWRASSPPPEWRASFTGNATARFRPTWLPTRVAARSAPPPTRRSYSATASGWPKRGSSSARRPGSVRERRAAHLGLDRCGGLGAGPG